MVKATFKITGVEDIATNLNSEIEKIGNNTVDGVAAAGQFVKGEAQKLTSIAEIEGGTLIKSAFAKATDQSGMTQEIGYTAGYAAAAHEMPDNTRWNRPGAENEFLGKAIVRNMTNIFNLIARFAGKG